MASLPPAGTCRQRGRSVRHRGPSPRSDTAPRLAPHRVACCRVPAGEEVGATASGAASYARAGPRGASSNRSPSSRESHPGPLRRPPRHACPRTRRTGRGARTRCTRPRARPGTARQDVLEQLAGQTSRGGPPAPRSPPLRGRRPSTAGAVPTRDGGSDEHTEDAITGRFGGLEADGLVDLVRLPQVLVQLVDHRSLAPRGILRTGGPAPSDRRRCKMGRPLKRRPARDDLTA